MFTTNKTHIKRVIIWGCSASAVLALLSLLRYPPLVAFSIVLGAGIGVFNIVSIVRLVEALAGAAEAGAPSKAAKAFSTFIHVIKLVLIFGLLLVLVMVKKVNLFGVLVGFTAVLIANVFAGFASIKEGGDDSL